MLKLKYFAFGSNILFEQMKWRIETIDKIERGTLYILNDYKLVFNVGYGTMSHRFANIVPESGAKVEGLLYDLTYDQLRRMDLYEALYKRCYFRIDDKTIACAYVGNYFSIMRKPGKPTLNYLNTILDGCREAELTWTYENLLKYKMENYKLKKSSKHK